MTGALVRREQTQRKRHHAKMKREVQVTLPHTRDFLALLEAGSGKEGGEFRGSMALPKP